MENIVAGQEPVEKPVEVKTTQPTASEVDSEVQIAQLLADNKKLSEERENYRIGMLKAKGKIQEDVEPDEDLDAKVARAVDERISQTRWAESQKNLEDTVIRIARENKELKKSLANRAGVSTSGQVSSQSSPEVRDQSLSPEKEAALLSRFKGSDEDKKRKLAEFKARRIGTR